MATTTNYGWTTPDNTDLVKDGASAIRTLGSSIDTTLKAQIDAQIPDSLLTTKGDIIAATGASTPARLGVGANDTVLVADSTAATGMKWAVPASGSMTLISTTTLTGASVTLSSIPQGYKNLNVVIKNLLPANEVQLRMRINGDTGTSFQTVTTFTGTNQTAGDNYIGIGGNLDNSTSQGLFNLSFVDYANTATWKIMNMNSYTNATASPTTTMNIDARYGLYYSTSAISSLTFFMATGNFTSGTVLLYGVN